MAFPERFEIWEADLGLGPHEVQKYGKRPVLIVSESTANKYHGTVTVVPFKSYRGEEVGFRSLLVEGGGLSHQSILAFNMLVTVPHEAMIRRRGVLPESYRHQVDLGIMKYLGLEERIPSWVEAGVKKGAR